ncbi:partial putative serine/threonine-protein kinase PkwA, partial [uncultured bacterium]
KAIQTLIGHNGNVNQLTFSADGQLLATASEDKTVRLWNVATGQSIRSLVGHSNMVFSVQFIGNGDTLLSASFDSTVRLWDRQSGVTLRILQGHEAGVQQTLLYSDTLYTASNDGTVRRWHLTLPNQQQLALTNTPLSNAITPNLNQVAVGFENGSLRLYDMEKQTWVDEKEKAHQGSIYHLTFDNKGTLLATAGLTDHVAKLWAVKQNQLKEQQSFEHTDAVYSVAISNDSQTLATANYDGKIGLFKIGKEDKQWIQAHTNCQITGCAEAVTFNKDDTLLLSNGNADRSIKIWNLNTTPPSLSQTLSQVNDKLLWSSWSPDNQRIVAVGRGNLINIYDTASSKLTQHLIGHEQTVFKAIFSPDSQQLVTIGDVTAKVWDIEQNTQLFSLHLPTELGSSTPFWDFDFRCYQEKCLMAVPLVRGVLQLYHFNYEGNPTLDENTEKRALLPLWQSYLEKAEILQKQNALQPAIQTLREAKIIGDKLRAIAPNDKLILKLSISETWIEADLLQLSNQAQLAEQTYEQALQLIQQLVKTHSEDTSNYEIGILNGLGQSLYKQKNYSKAQEIFANAITKYPKHLNLLATDAELALVQGDNNRFQQRLIAIEPLLAVKQGLFSEPYHACLTFLNYLADDKQSIQSIISAIEKTDKAVQYNWDFSDIESVIQQLPEPRKNNALLFIEFFKGKLDLALLKEKLK